MPSNKMWIHSVVSLYVRASKTTKPMSLCVYKKKNGNHNWKKLKILLVSPISRKYKGNPWNFMRALWNYLDDAILYLCRWLGYGKVSIFPGENNWHTFDTKYWFSIVVAALEDGNFKKMRFWRNFSWQFLNRGPDKMVQQSGPILSKTCQESLEDTSKNPHCMLVMEN